MLFKAFKMCFFFYSVCLVHPPESLSALRSRVSALEEELCAKAGMLKSVQNEMVQSKKELAAKELSAQRARDELSLAHTRIAQESDRVKTHTTTTTTDTTGTTTITTTATATAILRTHVFHTSANVLYFP